jgi:hypothetical protein
MYIAAAFGLLLCCACAVALDVRKDAKGLPSKTVHVIMGTIKRNGEYLYVPETISSWCTGIQQTPLAHRFLKWELVVFDFADPPTLTYDESDCKVTIIPAKRVPKMTEPDKLMKHSFDVAFMFDYVAQHMPASDYVMLMDDDFSLCYRAVDRLESAIAHFDDDFSAGLFSFGTSGQLYHVSDLPMIVRYIEEGQLRSRRRPIDHLLNEFVLKETPAAKEYLKKRRNYSIRNHPFVHRGVMSTQGHVHADEFGCEDLMTFPAIFKGLAFEPSECGEYNDVWPCT